MKLRDALLLLPALACGAALAADTPIADAPLFTSPADVIQPNLLFILDNSGSMDWSWLPDAAAPLARGPIVRYGRWAVQCNGLAYDPAIVYSPPVEAPGRRKPEAPVAFGDPASATHSHRPASHLARLPGPDTAVRVRVQQPGKRLSYERDGTVTAFVDASTYFVGTVERWDRGAGELTIAVERVVGTPGSPLPARFTLGKGEPPPPAYYVYTGIQPRLGYSHAPGGAVRTDTPFWRECASAVGSPPGRSVFREVVVSPGSSEAQNYANWARYYRSRMDVMKAGVSRAFHHLDGRFRVGYATSNEPDDPDNFLDVRDFVYSASTRSGHKKSFYDKLWGAQPQGGRPLRTALARAGQYYAGRMPGQAHDPVQHSCQRNFAILTTDGHWNGASLPMGLGSEPIGDRDHQLPPPLRDDHRIQNTLADVAAYYYETDLRDARWNNCSNGDGRDVCEDNVPADDGDARPPHADHHGRQHMTTFTLGLGVNGTLAYDRNYLAGASSDFNAIVQGTRAWPAPAADRAEAIDDLWHAAVNGRGRYFSASDPTTLSHDLARALAEIDRTTGAASAASTSALQPVAGGSDLFVAQFTTRRWTGDVLKYPMNPLDGAIGSSPLWSASEQLERLPPAARKVLYRRKGSAALQPFTFANLAAEGRGDWFSNFCDKAVEGELRPRQCAELNPDQLAAANSGENLVKYLAGDRRLEPVYRQRDRLLGDIINAAPLFVGPPSFQYRENGYRSFASSQAGRTAVVLAAANDGMVHAFDRTSGRELWAYIPSFVLDRLYRLADAGYADRHVFLVDGAPQLGDVWDPEARRWRTIAVGGLGAGGRGYYALDVTDPARPLLLWEFQHQHLGLSFGNPIITKRADGKWVVVFASGYNNTLDGGDGNGRLFVLDALQGGTPLLELPTLTRAGVPAGTPAAPSGLARINAWVPSELDNTALRFYGADLKGNLWRFDTDGRVAPAGKEGTLLAVLKDGHGSRQPVTTKPALGEVPHGGHRHAVVYVGTGRYLGLPDLRDSQTQTVYAIKDRLTDASEADVRGTDFVEQKVEAGGAAQDRAYRRGEQAPTPVDWSSRAGWRVDLPVGGERVTVNPQLVSDTLLVAGNLPRPHACGAGGESYLYAFHFAKGSFQSTRVGNVLVQGISVAQLATTGSASNGGVVNIITRSDGRVQSLAGAPATGGTLRRTSWRELVD